MLRFTVILALILASASQAATITKSYTFSPGGTIRSSELNTNFDTLYNEVNGLLDSANIENETLQSEDILNGTLTGSDVQDRSIGANDVGQGVIVGGDGGHLASGTVTGANIATSNVTRDHVASEEILSSHVRNFSIVGGNGGDLASGTITGGNIATDNVTEDHIAAGTIEHSDLDSRADTLPYSFSNLKIDTYSSSSQAVLTADHLALKNPDTGAWIIIQSVSETCAPTSGAASLTGQTTGFVAGNNTPYYLWVAAKSDGSSPVMAVSANTAIATVQNEFVALDSTYTFCGMYGDVFNQAAGSWSMRNQAQRGAHVSVMEAETLASISSTATNTSIALSSFMAVGIAHSVDVAIQVNEDTAGGSPNTLEIQGESGAGTLLTLKSDTDTALGATFANYPAESGVLYYSWNRAGGAGNASIGLLGYTIDHLAR